ncbi:MAG TPA: hypothetical protein VFA83_01590 [Acidimicrobiales bacterium]|nr:hypothetical protein [Acidimicrobiales bacterium]
MRQRIAIVGVSLALLFGISAPVMASTTSSGPQPALSGLCINIPILNMGPCLL